jgi:hypothetical protein
LDGCVAKIKYNAESVEMDNEELYVPDDVLEEATAAGHQILSRKNCRKNWKNLRVNENQ